MLDQYDIDCDFDEIHEILPVTTRNPDFTQATHFYFPNARLLLQYEEKREKGSYEIRVYCDSLDSLRDEIPDLINKRVLSRLKR